MCNCTYAVDVIFIYQISKYIKKCRRFISVTMLQCCRQVRTSKIFIREKISSCFCTEALVDFFKDLTYTIFEKWKYFFRKIILSTVRLVSIIYIHTSAV